MTTGFWPIYKREIASMRQSASLYVALGLLFLMAGAVYHDILVLFVSDSAMSQASLAAAEAPNITKAVIEQTFDLMAGMIMLVMPILSMRMIAAERSSGTFEALVTCPIGDWSILLGKYLALVTLGAAVAALSSVYPITTYLLGRGQGVAPDFMIVVSCGAGLFLIFCAYAAFGLMASALAPGQVAAAIVTLIGLLLWNMMAELAAGHPALQAAAAEISAARHTDNFIAGLVTLRDLAFYGLASFLCLFIAARALEARRWRA